MSSSSASNLQCAHRSSGISLKRRFWFSTSGQGLRVCLKLPGDAGAAGLGAHFKSQGSRGWCRYIRWVLSMAGLPAIRVSSPHGQWLFQASSILNSALPLDSRRVVAGITLIRRNLLQQIAVPGCCLPTSWKLALLLLNHHLGAFRFSWPWLFPGLSSHSYPPSF